MFKEELLTEISGMREENSPFITNEIVELDIALSSLSFKVYRFLSASRFFFKIK
jgi:hypothetical protein